MTERYLYAARRADGVVKFGCTEAPARRLWQLRATGGITHVLAVAPGSPAKESELLARLSGDVAEGREWFHPTDAVSKEVARLRARRRGWSRRIKADLALADLASPALPLRMLDGIDGVTFGVREDFRRRVLDRVWAERRAFQLRGGQLVTPRPERGSHSEG